MYKIEKIIKGNFKTYSIRITDEGSLILRVPSHFGDKDIENLLKRHSRWIENRLKNFSYEKKQFVNGEKFLFLGKEYTLTLVENFKTLQIKDDKLLIPADLENIQGLLEYWYKKYALEIFRQRAMIYKRLLGVEYKNLKISQAKTRWGSCSSLGNINIVWRLIMAPLEIIDYVIVHELAHLRHHNHSEKFWQLVESVLPDYKERRKWLKTNGYKLKL